VTSSDVARAWQVYSTHRDKAWSVTDCVSKVVIERLGVEYAFAFDVHFRQFGTLTVVP
jgi:predicted nucleic acid-binding protein